MSNWYVDFLNGNDAYTGNTTAYPAKTLDRLLSGTTFAVAAGDEVRVRGSENWYGLVTGGTIAFQRNSVTATTSANLTTVLPVGSFVSAQNNIWYRVSAISATQITFATNKFGQDNTTVNPWVMRTNLPYMITGITAQYNICIYYGAPGNAAVTVSGGWDASYTYKTGYTCAYGSVNTYNFITLQNPANNYIISDFVTPFYANFIKGTTSVSALTMNNIIVPYHKVALNTLGVDGSLNLNNNLYNSYIGCDNTGSIGTSVYFNNVTGNTFYGAITGGFSGSIFNFNNNTCQYATTTTAILPEASVNSNKIRKYINNNTIEGYSYLGSGFNNAIISGNTIRNMLVQTNQFLTDCTNIYVVDNTINATINLGYIDGSRFVNNSGTGYFTPYTLTNNGIGFLNNTFIYSLVASATTRKVIYSVNNVDKDLYFKYHSDSPALTLYRTLYGSVQLSGTNNTNIVLTPSATTTSQYPLYYPIGTFFISTGRTVSLNMNSSTNNPTGYVKVNLEQFGEVESFYYITGSTLTTSYQDFSGVLIPDHNVDGATISVEVVNTAGVIFTIDKVKIS